MFSDLIRGLWKENPTFRMLIGMCPTLAITTTATNGFVMGLSVVFVLACSNVIISLLRKQIPAEVRIPCYIVIIATFVTVVDLVLAAYVPGIHRVLGLFIPLITVNCLILGRAEAFASKMPVYRSFLDGIGMGLGFTIALVTLGSIREILGAGTIFGYRLLWEGFTPWVIMITPPGAFFTLGLLVGLVNWLSTAIAQGTLFRKDAGRRAKVGTAVHIHRVGSGQ